MTFRSAAPRVAARLALGPGNLGLQANPVARGRSEQRAPWGTAPNAVDRLQIEVSHDGLRETVGAAHVPRHLVTEPVQSLLRGCVVRMATPGIGSNGLHSRFELATDRTPTRTRVPADLTQTAGAFS